MKQEENTIAKATELYFKLKKSNFSDVQIRKIAQILSACSIDDSDYLSLKASNLSDYLQKNGTKHYKPAD